MSELSFEQMLDESFKTIRNGEVIEGTIIGVKEDEIILNIGYKADGIISRNEYSNDSNLDLTTVVSVGDTMEAKVLKVNDGEGQVLFTIVGAVIIGMLNNILNLINVSSYYQTIIKGVVILIAVLLDAKSKDR